MLGHLLLAVAACLPVDGDRILIGDLARAIPAFAESDATESIGYSPAPGAQRRFSAGELSRLAARKGVTATVEPVCFERKSEGLTRERVLAALRESLPEGAELELLEFSQTRVPSGSIEFPLSGLTASPRGPSLWRGRAKYGTAQSTPVWAKVRAPSEVVRGEMVGVEARYGAAFLKFEVRAEASGRTGDAIAVRNLESGKTFRARVLRKGWVAVEPNE